MEGALKAERRLDSDKAKRIVEAMRASVGRRGAAGSTFDHVAQEAGVSRGLLHYYFGSKERLLVEVVRHDSDVRMRHLEEGLSEANSVDAIVQSLVTQLKDFVDEDPAATHLDQATVDEGSNAFLVITKTLSGDVRPTIDWRGAMAFGAGLGLVLSILRRIR